MHIGRIHANGAHKIYMRDIAYLIYTLTDVAQDAAHLAQVRHSFVRARREPLDDNVNVGPELLTVLNLVELHMFL